MKSKKTRFLAMTALVAILTVGVAGIPESNAAKPLMYEVTVCCAKCKNPRWNRGK